MSKICKNCLCENDERYIFCKNCGTPLEENKPYSNNPYEEINLSQYEDVTQDGIPMAEEIDGVPVSTVGVFVGKNSDKFLAKFSRIQRTESKSSWCWPAAILGALLGFMGSALWLLYRKMYKPAVAAIAIAITLTIAATAITYDTLSLLGTTFSNYISKIWYAEDVGEVKLAAEEYAEDISEIVASPEYASSSRLANFLRNAECISAALVFGFFGINLYKKHAVQKIKRYDEKNGMSEYYTLGLKTLGGTSGASLALGIVIAAVIPTVIELLPFIRAFI